MDGAPGGERSESAVINVAVIEDQNQIREGLRLLIDGTPGYRCAGAFRCMEDVLERIELDMPDVVLVDIGLPGISGIDGIRILKQRHPGLLLVALTVYNDDKKIFEAICSGASGYLLKKTSPGRLLDSIREAMDGGAPMTPEVAKRVITLFRSARIPVREEHQLTPHEVRLLKMLVNGHNYKTSAVELGVSFNTVKFHMRHIYEKLHVHSKSEAVSRALREGIV